MRDRSGRFRLVLSLLALLAGCDSVFSTDPSLDVQIEQATAWPTILDVGDTAKLEINSVVAQSGAVQAASASWQSSNVNVIRIEAYPANTGDPTDDSLAARRTRVRAIAVGAGTAKITISLDSTAGTRRAERTFDLRVRSWGQVVGLSNSTCGSVGRGVTYCWGATVGNPIPTPNASMRLVSALFTDNGIRLRSVVAGESHVCGEAMTSAGNWVCWGNNSAGQLTDGSDIDRIVPVVMNLNGISLAGLSVSTEVSCGVGPAGELRRNLERTSIYCWGQVVPAAGVISAHRDYSRPSPLDPIYGGAGDFDPGWGCDYSILPCPGYYSVSVGVIHACALYQGAGLSGRKEFAACWGRNDTQQLGRPTTLKARETADTVYDATVLAGTDHALTAIAATKTASCVLDRGELVCWGGKYGRTPTHTLPGVVLASITGSREGDQVCGVGQTDGTAYCLDTATGVAIPTPAVAADGITLRLVSMMTAGRVISGRDLRHYCGITTPDGAMYCWGDNTYGQLGRDTGGSRVTVPVRVPDPPTVP